MDDDDLQDLFSLDNIGFPYVSNLPGIESTLATDPTENPDKRELGKYVDQIQNLDIVGLSLNLDLHQDFAHHISQGAGNVEANYVVIDNYSDIQCLFALTSSQAFIGYYIPTVNSTSYSFFVSC